MPLNNQLIEKLKGQGADFVSFVDISSLPEKQNRGFQNAILIGMVLSPKYLQKITQTPNYVQNMVRNEEINQDEFHLKELKTDELADYAANYLSLKGFSAYSQSENNIFLTGFYNEKTKSTPLPHKVIAGLAGLGWIGKHNLIVSTEFGSAISICTVLTDAPLLTIAHKPMQSKCGDCNVCVVICPTNAIKGKSWDLNVSREQIVDVYKCTTCIECLVHCPWTQAYVKKIISLD